MKVFALLAISSCLAVQIWSVTVKQAALTGHNDLRRQEAKAEDASNLYEYVWSTALANEAQTLADSCVYHHDHARSEGQNIYYQYPIRHPDSYYVDKALEDWYSEKSLATNDFSCCHDTYDCCHYTQIVAARSKKVGCAVAHCDALTRNGHTIAQHAAYVVCNYDPLGNMAYNGHFTAYAVDAPCGGCANGDTCNDGLCVA